jgi:uncharacterized iron-regulated membrane protein
VAVVIPLVVLATLVWSLRWLVKKARVTQEDVMDAGKGAAPGRHLPALSTDVRDFVPLSPAVETEIDRVRMAPPPGGS